MTEYERGPLPTAMLVWGVVVLNTLVLLWLWIALEDTDMAALFTGTLVLANLSGLLGGVAYRLSELRDELIRRADLATDDPAEKRRVLANAPSKRSVRSRMVWAGIGMGLSAIAVLLAIAIPSPQDRAEIIVVAFTILVSAVACGMIATFMRPFE